MRLVLKRVFQLELPPGDVKRWSFHDFGFWRRECENNPEPRYNRQNNKQKQKVFILGLVRNPFSYYRSLYAMIQVTKAKPVMNARLFIRSNGTQGSMHHSLCPFYLAFKHSKGHLFVGDKNLRTTSQQYFEEFMHLILDYDSECGHRNIVNMQGRHDNLMLMNDGSMAYDAVVQQEMYYPMLRQALEQFDGCMPNVTHFDILNVIEQEQDHVHSRSQYLKKKILPPDHCYYSPDLREKVERNDRVMMQRYNYSWESFVGTRESFQNDCIWV